MRTQRIPLVWILTIFLLLAMSTYFSLFNKQESSVRTFIEQILVRGPTTHLGDDLGDKPGHLATDDTGDDAGDEDQDGKGSVPLTVTKPFPPCSEDVDLVPCHDKKYNSRIGITSLSERHCPPFSDSNKCLLTAPAAYKAPLAWPDSRDAVWLSNVKESRLAEGNVLDVAAVDRDRVAFKKIEKYVQRVIGVLSGGKEQGGGLSGLGFQTVLDINTNAGAFGAAIKDDVPSIVSVGPLSTSVQLASERGLLSLVSPFSSKRQPFPAASFDLVHCGLCQIKWWDDGGMLMAELGRILRPGGYFVWSAPKDTAIDWAKWLGTVATKFCWKQVGSDGGMLAYQREDCGGKNEVSQCDTKKADETWQMDVGEPCTMPLPGGQQVLDLAPWPDRLFTLPASLKKQNVDTNDFLDDSRAWSRRVQEYWEKLDVRKGTAQRVLDMDAGWGGFGAALTGNGRSILNVARPQGSSNALFERGLVGLTHSWCEPLSAYPRSFDLIHASTLLSRVMGVKDCSFEGVLVEMDRLLRPGGYAIFRDTEATINVIKRLLPGLQWKLLERLDSGDDVDGKELTALLCVKEGPAPASSEKEEIEEKKMPAGDSETTTGSDGDGGASDGGDNGDAGETGGAKGGEGSREEPRDATPESEPAPAGSYVLPGSEAKTYEPCDWTMSEWVPCHDEEYNKKAKVPRAGYSFLERHCPPQADIDRCLVPPPSGYQVPIRWPESRDSVWLSNVPHTKLADYKADQKWMKVEDDKVTFPGGGTFSKMGAIGYIESIEEMISEDKLKFHDQGVRLVLDIGAGVASFGGALLDQDIMTASFAPLDVHQAQVQFALERGIPAYVGALASKKMPYSNNAFELAHCSWCRIQWWDDDGASLAEVDRVLRPGAFFVWTSPAASWNDTKDQEWRKNMEELVTRLCWTEYTRKGLTVVWRKPMTSDCYKERSPETKPSLCEETNQDQDLKAMWDSNFAGCLLPFQETEAKAASELKHWPDRMSELPRRLESVGISAADLQADTEFWKKAVDEYWSWMSVGEKDIRNVMDMNAHMGGFAAALVGKPLWVYNVVPTEGVPNTLGGLIDRGFLSTAHNWCEAFSTYPRTYDLVHADNILSLVSAMEGCSTEGVLLEIDRILRPLAFVIIRDSEGVVARAAAEIKGLRWDLVKGVRAAGADGKQQVVLLFKKQMWTLPEDATSGGGGQKAKYNSDPNLPSVWSMSPGEFEECKVEYQDWIPCHDQAYIKTQPIARHSSIHYERHCPPTEDIPKCLIPPPVGYKLHIAWPQSRDEVWFANVPHTRLADYKADQKWMVVVDDKVTFPGGGTYSKGGAATYVGTLSQMLGKKTLKDFGIRMVLDMGCGVASFGGILLDQDVMTIGLAPPDVHESQVQFALERGIPTIVGALGEKKQPYPAQVFDMAHCSWCRINWGEAEGIRLVEMDRVLRPGGIFIWTSPAALWDNDRDSEWRKLMLDTTERLCWKMVAKEQLTMVWQKPTDNTCYNQRAQGTSPPLCDTNKDSHDPRMVWGTNMSVCITPVLPEISSLQSMPLWPKRLDKRPERLKADFGVSAEAFDKDSEEWRNNVNQYWELMEDTDGIRNIIDMNPKWGGFAAALVDKPVWVMNTVPIQGDNTVGSILDRGLLALLHNWCEPFSTYPRTYDMMHAWNIFSLGLKHGCAVERLLLEMDRILRPRGWAIFRDEQKVIESIKALGSAMRWQMMKTVMTQVLENGEQEVILIMRKRYWVVAGSLDDGQDDSGDSSGTLPLLKGYDRFAVAPPKPPVEVCKEGGADWVPCHDVEYNKRAKVSNKGYEFLERHCPPITEMPQCIVPPPEGYKIPIPWPQSRDEVWLANIPHTKLATVKADQKWMTVEGDKVSFRNAGGTFFKGGAVAYAEMIGKMLTGKEGGKIKDAGVRLALDIGCGVASFGGVLLDQDILTASFAPPDNHDNQIQFALERGIPAIIGSLASQRLPYPSGTFEMAHCSWCRIDWAANHGALIIEIDRVIKPGGFFVWTSPATTFDDEVDKEWREKMLKITPELCWEEVARERITIVWRKLSTPDCLSKRAQDKEADPPVCDEMAVAITLYDVTYDQNISSCIMPFHPHRETVEELPRWPERLTTLTKRMQSIGVDDIKFKEDLGRWKKRVGEYWQWLGDGAAGIRNVMDMSAGLGGFAAALALANKPVWVMNVIQSGGVNPSLPAIVDRGLLGTSHNWCRPYSTYPRTYDLLHANMLLSLLTLRGCQPELLLLEADRILRPHGYMIIRDDFRTVKAVSALIPALRWDILLSAQSGRNEAIIIARKHLWLADGSDPEKNGIGGADKGRAPGNKAGHLATETYNDLKVDEPTSMLALKDCAADRVDWVPCHDFVYNKQVLGLRRNGYHFMERHCPSQKEINKCLIPPPPNYQSPVRWPQSRDAVWLSNVNHPKLADYKSNQKWMQVEGDKVIFPGGGTFSKQGVKDYLDFVTSLILEKDEGTLSKTAGIRMAVDIGCGVASMGAALLDISIMTSSFAPPDVHEAQVQFALERGIPAYLNALATRRLPYPSSSFELAHCSWCRIDWADQEGLLLLEVDRILRPGGYFIWTSPAAVDDDADHPELREGLEKLVPRFCWTEIKRGRKTIVWRKPIGGFCTPKMSTGEVYPRCPPDAPVYNTNMTVCMTGMEGKPSLSQIPIWPDRLIKLPARLAGDGVDVRDFKRDTELWQGRVQSYYSWMGEEAAYIRNVMDMNAIWGGFATAMELLQKPVWVLSTVHPENKAGNLLGIMERGLLGMYHDWCEAFSTYPRTYDLVHAHGLFTLIRDQASDNCKRDMVMLEMDRILRPKGWAIIRDSAALVKEIVGEVGAFRWTVVKAVEVGDEAIIVCQKSPPSNNE